MAVLMQCDRCRETSSNFESIVDPPDGWHHRTLPVRGSQGARSDGAYLLCQACDDSLYRWLRDSDPEQAR